MKVTICLLKKVAALKKEPQPDGENSEALMQQQIQFLLM